MDDISLPAGSPFLRGHWMRRVQSRCRHGPPLPATKGYTNITIVTKVVASLGCALGRTGRDVCDHRVGADRTGLARPDGPGAGRMITEQMFYLGR